MIAEIMSFFIIVSAFFRMCHQKCSIINKYKGSGQCFLKSLMVQEDIILITLHALYYHCFNKNSFKLFRVLSYHALFESCHSNYLGHKILTSCRVLPKNVFFQHVYKWHKNFQSISQPMCVHAYVYIWQQYFIRFSMNINLATT